MLSDINAAMLEVGRDRLLDRGILRNVQFSLANAECLPFADETFDCVTIGFGLRNVTDKAAAIASMRRVLKPGGRLLILEFSKPVFPGLKPVYDAYSFSVLPWLGARIASDSGQLPLPRRVHPPFPRPGNAARHDAGRGPRGLPLPQPDRRHRRAAQGVPLLSANPVTAIFDRLSTVLNRNVAQSERAATLAEQLEGRALSLVLEGTPLTLFFRVAAGRIAIETRDDGDGRRHAVRLAALAAVPGRSGAEDRLRGSSIRIAGDAEVAQRFRDLLQHAQPDFEEELSRVVGDVAAHQVASLARGFFGWGRKAADSSRPTWRSTCRKKAATCRPASKSRNSSKPSTSCARPPTGSKPA